MSRTAEADLPPPGAIGPGEALGHGWRVLTGDFGRLVLVGLAVEGILTGMYMLPCISYLAPLALVFLYGPLMAGLFLAVRARMDGGPSRPGWAFLGFKHRYWDTVLVALPITLTELILVGLLFVFQVGVSFSLPLLMEELETRTPGAGGPPPAELLGMLATMHGVPLLAQLSKQLVKGVMVLALMFAFLAVWEFPREGWEAVRRSVRLVRANLTDALLLGLAFGGLYAAAGVIGLLLCCVGWFPAFAIFDIWFAATVTVVYRVWTGQPMYQEFVPPEVIARGPEPGAPPGAVPPPAAPPPPGPGEPPPGGSVPPEEGGAP